MSLTKAPRPISQSDGSKISVHGLRADPAEIMVDLTGADYLEVRIDHEKGVVWINDVERCIFRACRVKHIELQEMEEH